MRRAYYAVYFERPRRVAGGFRGSERVERLVWMWVPSRWWGYPPKRLVQDRLLERGVVSMRILHVKAGVGGLPAMHLGCFVPRALQ